MWRRWLAQCTVKYSGAETWQHVAAAVTHRWVRLCMKSSCADERSSASEDTTLYEAQTTHTIRDEGSERRGRGNITTYFGAYGVAGQGHNP